MTTVIHLKQINTLFHFTFERRLKGGGRLLIFTLLSACFSRRRSPIAHTVAGTMLKYWAVYTERGQWKPPQPVRQYRKATVDSHNICRCSDPSRTLCCPLFSWKENRAAISWLNCTNLYSPKSFWTGPIIWFWVQNGQNKLSESITSWPYNVHISTAGIRRGSTGVNPSIQVCVWRQKKIDRVPFWLMSQDIISHVDVTSSIQDPGTTWRCRKQGGEEWTGVRQRERRTEEVELRWDRSTNWLFFTLILY